MTNIIPARSGEGAIPVRRPDRGTPEIRGVRVLGDPAERARVVEPIPGAPQRLLAEAAAALRAGGAVVFPTETFYALGADPRSAEGVAAVFRLKARPACRRLPWIAASRAQVESVCRLPAEAAALAERYWPGPLTLVLPARAPAAGTVAVRVSSHPLARGLAAALGHPVISTSANRSGAAPVTTASEAARGLAVSGAAGVSVLDGGETPGGAPSVIVDAAGGELRTLRGSLAGLEQALRRGVSSAESVPRSQFRGISSVPGRGGKPRAPRGVERSPPARG